MGSAGSGVARYCEGGSGEHAPDPPTAPFRGLGPISRQARPTLAVFRIYPRDLEIQDPEIYKIKRTDTLAWCSNAVLEMVSVLAVVLLAVADLVHAGQWSQKLANAISA